MKKHILYLSIFAALAANAIEFGDIEAKYPLYSVSDPFAITVATNAYRIANAEAANRAAAIASATNALYIKVSADISDEATERINGDSVNNSAIANLATHTNSATAHPTLFAPKVSTNDTRPLVFSRVSVTNGLSASSLLLSTNYVATGAETLGTVFWDTASKTLVIVYPNGQMLNVGEEDAVPVQNDTGATITNGMTVMYVGTIGNSGNIRVAPAYVTSATDVHRVIGMATTDIPDGAVGKVTRRGKVRGIRTNGAEVGETWVNTAELYVTTNSSLAGYCTTNRPQAPYPAVRVAKVTSAHASNGTYDVCLEFPVKFTDLSDVNGTPLTASGQFAVWDAVRGVFDFSANANGFVPTNRTVTVNGVTGSLSSNVAFTVSALYNPTNSSEYIDGAGRKYAISNFWEMTFSAAFAGGYSLAPAQTNYLFTAYDQEYYERPGGAPNPYWSIKPTSLNYFPGGFYTWDWAATTNAYVLDPIVGGATGHAYIRAYSTTTLVDSVVMASGATMTGRLATSIDQTSVAPANNDLVSAAWVRGLAMSGQEWYFTSSVTNGFGNKTTNFVALASSIPGSAFTNALASPLSSNAYLAGGITTNTYTALRSPITLDAYMARSGGNAASVLPVHPEIYYVYAGTTNHLGDWSVPDQMITATTPTRYTWVVAFPEPSITGSVRVIAYMKSGTVSGPSAGLNIYGGGIFSSHIDIQNVAASGGVSITDVRNEIRSTVYTNQVWASPLTNATYRMSWDATNGTFLVEEILP